MSRTHIPPSPRESESIDEVECGQTGSDQGSRRQFNQNKAINPIIVWRQTMRWNRWRKYEFAALFECNKRRNCVCTCALQSSTVQVQGMRTEVVSRWFSSFAQLYPTSERAQLKNLGLPSAVRTREIFGWSCAYRETMLIEPNESWDQQTK